MQDLTTSLLPFGARKSGLTCVLHVSSLNLVKRAQKYTYQFANNSGVPVLQHRRYKDGSLYSLSGTKSIPSMLGIGLRAHRSKQHDYVDGTTYHFFYRNFDFGIVDDVDDDITVSDVTTVMPDNIGITPAHIMEQLPFGLSPVKADTEVVLGGVIIDIKLDGSLSVAISSITYTSM